MPLGMTDEAFTIVRERSTWPGALTKLRVLVNEHGAAAEVNAQDYASVYANQRGCAVVDVVASRRRNYRKRVLPMVDVYRQWASDGSLATLADHGPGDDLGLMRSPTDEAETMRAVAAGLLEFGVQHGLRSDEEVCRVWADQTEPLQLAPALDPYVGNVKGIGLALFAYLRMRSGGSGLKPDVQTRRALNGLGFEVPAGDIALLLVAAAAAAELGISLLVLDQLLWWSTQ